MAQRPVAGPGALRRRRHRDLPGPAGTPAGAGRPGLARAGRRDSGPGLRRPVLVVRRAARQGGHRRLAGRDRRGPQGRPAQLRTGTARRRTCRWRRPAWSTPASSPTRRWSSTTRRSSRSSAGSTPAATRTSRCTGRCPNWTAEPGTWPGCSGTSRPAGPAPRRQPGRGRPGHAAGVLPDRHRRLGAGQDQRPRPVRRGRPARLRGRRRLRRRGAPARPGHRRGARRPGPGAADRRARRRRAGRDGGPRWSDGWTPRSLPCRSWPTTPPGCARRSGRSARTSPACRCSGCTATTTSARCCAPRTAGWCSTSRASRPSRCPNGPGSTRRCGTWPGCCARSTTRPGTCSPTTRSSRTWPTARTSGRPATGTRSCDGYVEAGGPDPRDGPRAAARVRGGQGGLRGRLRGPQPPVVAADPAGLAGPTHRRSTVVTSTQLTADPAGLSREELDRLVGGVHHDPHSVLGLHPVRADLAPPAPVSTASPGAERDRPGGGGGPAAHPGHERQLAGGRRRPGQGATPAGWWCARCGRTRAGSPRCSATAATS